MTETAARSRVTTLAGFSPAATDAVARSLLVADPGLLLVTHDLTDVREGVVRRTIRTADGVLEEARTDLVHGCVSCTLREDVVPTLLRLSRDRPGAGILLALPPAVEPSSLAAAAASISGAASVSGQTSAGPVSDATPAGPVSDATAAGPVSGATAAGPVSGAAPSASASGAPPVESASGAAPAESASGAAPAESASGAASASGAGEIVFDSFVTVVEAAALLDDLTSTDDLRDRGMHSAANDRRGVAEVVARQIEYADTVVVWGSPALDPFDRGRATELLHRLAPWAVQVRVGDGPVVDCTGLAARLLGTGRHDPAVPGMLGRALEGYPIGLHDPSGEHGVSAMLFQSRRPFHPQRLHDALDEVAGTSLRGRGQLWIATQPDTAIALESAGGSLMLGNLGLWLAALPRERWSEATTMRRLSADAAWDAYYGDRATALSFVGLGLDTDDLTARLNACLLTDAELAAGAATWSTLPDPFADYFPQDDESGRPAAVS